MTTTDLQFQEGKILIIGDLIIDETWYVEATKLSPEGPVPVVMLTSNKPIRKAGGAGLASLYAVKNNIPIHLLTACNRENKTLLQENRIQVSSVEPIVNVVKKRYIDINSGYHLIRIDNDKIIDPPRISTQNICPKIEEIIKTENISIVAIFDYRKGMFLDKDTCQEMISVCKKNKIPTYVDTRCSPLKFKGATYIKLNGSEYKAAHRELRSNNPFDMCKSLKINNLIVTLGKDGAKIYSPNGNKTAEFWPDKYNGTPDVTGCGDVFGINFCYHSSMRSDLSDSSYDIEVRAVRIAVDRASKFAYQKVDERI